VTRDVRKCSIFKGFGDGSWSVEWYWRYMNMVKRPCIGLLSISKNSFTRSKKHAARYTYAVLHCKLPTSLNLNEKPLNRALYYSRGLGGMKVKVVLALPELARHRSCRQVAFYTEIWLMVHALMTSARCRSSRQIRIGHVQMWGDAQS
jgi:hypothetical protein